MDDFAKDTNVPANDCVFRQAAIDAWKEDFKGFVNSLDMQRDDYKGIMEYIDEVPSAQPEPRWIPVENEPPKEFNRYWVCTDTGYQCECRWTNNVYGLQISGKWGWSIFDIPQYSKVVAYMPLPKPYKEEE